MELVHLLKQLETAKDKLLAELRDLDAQIHERHRQRDLIRSGTISKAEYVALLKETFARRGEPFIRNLRREIQQGGLSYAATVERFSKAKEGLYGAWLPSATPYNEAGQYFYFGDLMAERIGEALADLPFDEQAASQSEREAALAELDEQIVTLGEQRAHLVAQLKSAGLKE